MAVIEQSDIKAVCVNCDCLAAYTIEDNHSGRSSFCPRHLMTYMAEKFFIDGGIEAERAYAEAEELAVAFEGQVMMKSLSMN